MGPTERDALTIADCVAILRHGRTLARNATRPRFIDRQDSQIRFNEWRRMFYSYGEHFPLALYVPPRRGDRGAVWIINGDRWPGGGFASRTNGHQAATREAITSTADACGDSVIVQPFPTMLGAGIELDTVRPVDVRPDANWTERRESPYLADVPRRARTIHYSVTMDAATLADVPQRYRETWRLYTEAEAEAFEAEHGRRAPDWSQRLDRLPDADGRYRWDEPRTRPIEADADGLYRWDVSLHRLGDALFTAVRPDVRERRARPGESVTVDAETHTERELCAANPYAPGDGSGAAHIADASGRACIFCGRSTRPIAWTARPRGLYLSSFDTEENPPLYFLAELPRKGPRPRTIPEALDALAPPAVHAARARGRRVYRQGDIFYIETDATSAELAARGATFARLTQWTRDAAPRAGEAGYIAPRSRGAITRRATAERNYRARRFRESFGSALAQLTSGTRDADAHAERRAETAARWRELLARHAEELAPVVAAGVDVHAAESSACNCGAAIGAPCVPIPAEAVGSASLAARIEEERERYGAHRARPEAIAKRHERERSELAGNRYGRTREGGGNGPAPGRPSTEHGARKRYRVRVAGARAELEKVRAELRAAAFGAVPDYLTRPGNRIYGETHAAHMRRARATFAREARKRYADAEARLARALHERGADRDAYRRPYNRRATPTSAAALITWRNVTHEARLRFRPETVDGSDHFRRRRETVRRACAIYGTSHGATETARLRDGTFYARGVARHVPELEPGRAGGRDHRDVSLGDRLTWYVAVRNTVPRQRRAAAGARR